MKVRPESPGPPFLALLSIVGHNLEKPLKNVHMFLAGFPLLIMLLPFTFKILGQTFPGGHFTFLPHMFPSWKKKCQRLLLPQHRMVHIMERMRETEKNATLPASVGHLSREVIHSN